MKWSNLIFFLLVAIALSAETAYVERVVDGDTFVNRGGQRVRMTGINAPESDAAFGSESTRYLRTLIEGKKIELQKDRYSDDKDKYGRLLRYAILDGTDINLKMVEDGYAWAFTRYKFSKSSEYKSAEQSAEQSLVGLWPTYVNGAGQSKSPDAQGSNKEKKSARSLIIVIVILIIGYFLKKVKGRR